MAGEFAGRLADRAAQLRVGDPLDREVYMGPVIDDEAVDRFKDAVSEARKEGRVLAGGEVLSDDLPEGHYVAPTVVADLPPDHRLFKDELFVPFVAVAPVDSLDEALKLANDTEYGLTAGFYSSRPGRGRPVPGPDRGRGRLRQPQGRGHHRRLAGGAAVRRLEGVGQLRQGRRRPLLRPAVHARAVPDGDQLDQRRLARPDRPVPDLAPRCRGRRAAGCWNGTRR